MAFVAAVNWLAQVIINAGWSIYHLGVRQGKEMPYGCLLDGFAFLGKLILLNIVMGIFVYLWSLLFLIPGIIASTGTGSPFIICARIRRSAFWRPST